MTPSKFLYMFIYSGQDLYKVVNLTQWNVPQTRAENTLLAVWPETLDTYIYMSLVLLMKVKSHIWITYINCVSVYVNILDKILRPKFSFGIDM